MASNPFSPLNDFTRHVLLEQVNGSTGATEAVTTGTVTGFIATSNTVDATTADASWSVAGTYIGGANGFVDGTWQFAIDAAVITLAKCTTAGFVAGTATPYFIVQKDSAFRVVEKLKYTAVRNATVA
jgi:hypothetical protein